MSKNQLAPAPFAPVTPFGRPATLHSLPDDVLLLVICFIRVKDILSLRQVSGAYHVFLHTTIDRDMVAFQDL